MSKAICNLLVLFIITVCLFSCSENEEKTGGVREVNGTIEKGPFLTGSKVTLYELDENLNQTGKNFRTETINDKGDFLFSGIELSSNFVELEISGYFFNEVDGRRSNSQINLNALTDLSDKGNVNVNILTHLECKRVKNLIKQGKSFSNAKELAEKDLLKLFLISTDFKRPEKISLTDGDENAAMLLAISAILLYDKSESEFSEFISKLSNEFAEKGKITDHLLKEEIVYGSVNVNALAVMENIEKYYKSQGTEVVVNNIRKYIDGNGDGVLDERDETIDDGTVIVPPIEQDDEEAFMGLVQLANEEVSKYFQLITVLDAVRCNQASLADIQINPNNVLLANAWSYAYTAMSNIHQLIGRDYPNFSFDAKPYIGSLRLLRSLVYLDMVQHWGGVPLVTSILDPGDTRMPRNSKAEVLAFVIKETEDILYDLPEVTSDENFILSIDLAHAVCANAMLEKEIGEYQKAADLLQTIADNDKYSLMGRDNAIYQTNNRENIFSLKLTASTIFQPFEEIIKHEGSLHPIYRYTGVMLNYAEALYRLGKYSEMTIVINKVRKSLNESELSSLSQNDAGAEIARLWREIIGKDYGFFALLKQLNLAVSELNIEEYMTLYPIPLKEISMNPSLVQNPNY